MLSRKILLCFVSGFLVLAGSATAQQSVSQGDYSAGAGAYFSGRFDDAIPHLTEWIGEFPNDARGHYMRGLSYLAKGDLRQAQVDLNKGAEIEANAGISSPQVERALAGVQGQPRMILERIRRAARENRVMQERQQVIQAIKQAREQREAKVLRTNYTIPIEALASRLTVAQARDVAMKDRGPIGEIMPQVAVNASQPESDNPFADDLAAGSSSNNAEMEAQIRSSFFGSFFTAIGKAASGRVDEAAAEAIPMAMGPVGMGGGPPEGFGGGDFEGGDFGGGDFGGGDFGGGDFGGGDFGGGDFGGGDFGGGDFGGGNFGGGDFGSDEGFGEADGGFGGDDGFGAGDAGAGNPFGMEGESMPSSDDGDDPFNFEG